jgi:carboxymethylenebutenolidase
MATLVRSTESIPAGDRSIAAYVARPRSGAELPAVIAWSDIFQLTPPHLRMVDRIASHGFVVVAPEIYSKIEPAGTALDFDRDRQRALDDAARMEVAWIDEERRAVIDWIVARPGVDAGRLSACGWCFGGHLAVRAALEPEVRATACFYATGVHSGDLGKAKGTAGTLERAAEIRGSILLVWGTNDPHIPEEGRRAIHAELARSGARFEIRLFEAEHAFMRDAGPRWDPEAADAAVAHVIDFFRRASGRG